MNGQRSELNESEYWIRLLGILSIASALFALVSFLGLKYPSTWHTNWVFIKKHVYFGPFVVFITLLLLVCILKGKGGYRKRELFGTRWDMIFPSVALGTFSYLGAVLVGFMKSDFIPMVIAFLFILSFVYCFARAFSQIKHENPAVEQKLDTYDKIKADMPIQDPKEDMLERNRFVERLAQIVSASYGVDSLVVGLYGPWGSGKSSVFSLLDMYVQDHNVLVMKFNPRFFKDSESLIHQFLQQFGQTVAEETKAVPGEFLQTINNYIERLVPTIQAGIGAITINGSAFQKQEKDIISLKEEIENTLLKAKRRMLVMIDDVDRLNLADMEVSFKLVNLIASFPYTTYLLAIDPEKVLKVFGEQGTNNVFEIGESPLEKFVQVPVHLPPADPIQLRKMVFDDLKASFEAYEISLIEDQEARLASIWMRTIGVMMKTPRRAKQYGNAIKFSLPLLRGEVNIVDLLLIEAIHLLLPELHRFIRDHPHIVLLTNQIDKKFENEQKKLQEFLKGLRDEHQDIVKELLGNLFPQLNKIMNRMTFGPQLNWVEMEVKQRICSPTYFDRYFRYVVPERDIPDVSFELLLEQVKQSNDVARIRELFNDLADTNGKMKRLIEKLRLIEFELPDSTAEKIIKVVGQVGMRLPQYDGAMMFDSTRNQAAILIRNLLFRLPQTQMITLIKELMIVGEPLDFAHDILRWVIQKEGSEDKRLSKEESHEVASVFIDRMQKEAQTAEFLKRYPIYAISMLMTWAKWRDATELKKVISQWFRVPDALEDFLLAFGPHYIYTNKMQSQGIFAEEQYDWLQTIYPPAEVYRLLRQRYGKQLTTLRNSSDHSGTTVLETIERFIQIHEGRLNKIRMSELKPKFLLNVQGKNDGLYLSIVNNGNDLGTILLLTGRKDIGSSAYTDSLRYWSGEHVEGENIGIKKVAGFQVQDDDSYVFQLPYGYNYPPEHLEKQMISSLSVYYEDRFGKRYRTRVVYLWNPNDPKIKFEAEETLEVEKLPYNVLGDFDIRQIYAAEMEQPIIFRPKYRAFYRLSFIEKCKGTLISGGELSFGQVITVEDIILDVFSGYPILKLQINSNSTFNIKPIVIDGDIPRCVMEDPDQGHPHAYEKYGLNATGSHDAERIKQLYHKTLDELLVRLED